MIDNDWSGAASNPKLLLATGLVPMKSFFDNTLYEEEQNANVYTVTRRSQTANNQAQRNQPHKAS
jgi:hypothetical protein